MKIVILDAHAVNPGDLSWDFLNAFGQVDVYDTTPADLVIPRIADADIILINKVVIDQAVLDACPKLKLICVLATGYNVVDCDACAKKGIPVTNVAAYGTDAVAQFTFSLLLELCNRVGLHDHLVHQGQWPKHIGFCFWETPQMELAGKTLGIIGFGRIGRAVGRIAKAFGMEVLAFNRSQCPEGQAIAQYVDLDTLLEQADVISLHSGKLRGFAADVVSAEPILDTNPLLTAPNCILTPHMAWAPIESRRRILDSVTQSIEGFLSGKPVNTVNM